MLKFDEHWDIVEREELETHLERKRERERKGHLIYLEQSQLVKVNAKPIALAQLDDIFLLGYLMRFIFEE